MAHKINKISQGFTIIELMLASMAFSVALLVAISGFIGIGRLFFKGVSNSQTQQITRQAIDDIAGNIRTAPSISDLQQSFFGPSNLAYYLYYCIGNIRYTYGHTEKNIPIMFDSSKSVDYDPSSLTANFGLLKDKLPGSSACAAPCPPGAGCAAPLTTPQELLDSKMRVGDLDIHKPLGSTDNLFLVSLDVAYGDESSMVFDRSEPTHVQIQCSGHISTQQFCGITTLSTDVYSGIHP
jgi:prepilin-type N-terminal cleavage/methylation domain-containing protein